jgi:hypothetical protein
MSEEGQQQSVIGFILSSFKLKHQTEGYRSIFTGGGTTQVRFHMATTGSSNCGGHICTIALGSEALRSLNSEEQAEARRRRMLLVGVFSGV